MVPSGPSDLSEPGTQVPVAQPVGRHFASPGRKAWERNATGPLLLFSPTFASTKHGGCNSKAPSRSCLQVGLDARPAIILRSLCEARPHGIEIKVGQCRDEACQPQKTRMSGSATDARPCYRVCWSTRRSASASGRSPARAASFTFACPHFRSVIWDGSTCRMALAASGLAHDRAPLCNETSVAVHNKRRVRRNTYGRFSRIHVGVPSGCPQSPKVYSL